MADNYNPTLDGQDPPGPQSFDATSTTMPITQQQTPINKITNNVQGGGGGSGGGGFNPTSVIGPIASILGSFLAEGGTVGYAQGGMGTQPSGGDNTALAKGYLVGALHQKKFGGTPDTLPKAAQEIKAMLSGQGGQPQGLASGGSPQEQQGMNQADQQLAMQSLMQALWMGSQQGSQQAQPPQNPQATQNPPINPQQTAPNIPQQSNLPQGMQNSMVGGSPNQMRGYAGGGMQIGPQQPQTPGGGMRVAPQGAPGGGYPQPPMPGGGPPAMPNGVNPQMAHAPPPNMMGPPNAPPPPPPQGYMQPGGMGGMRSAPMGGRAQNPKLGFGQVGGTGYAEGGPDDQPPLQQGQTFQGDGSVKGPGTGSSDSIPAKLSNGEFVMSQPAVQFFGVDKLTKMNEQGKQGFMQAQQQVQANQPGAQAQAPDPGQQAASSSPPMPQQAPQGAPQMPMMQRSGGSVNTSAMRPKSSGYMGM